jgi:exopolysaccharide production protein ExoZ
MPKTTSWNIGIQLLRGIAATLVVFHHSLEQSLAISGQVAPEWLIRFGACGVDIFFVISGFIIYSVTYGRDPRNPEPAPLFLLKRFTRIFPLYWICLLATLALWSSGQFYRSLHPNAQILGASIFLLPSNKLVVDVAWTLVYEMYFYYLFSITLYLRNARISILTTTALIAAGLFSSRFLPEGSLKDFLANPIALEFCYGLILAYFIHFRALEWSLLRHLWLPGLILLAVSAALPERHSNTSLLPANVRYFAWGLPALLVTLSFIKSQFSKSWLTRILLPIGDASYAIYLTHPMMMILFATLIKLHLLKSVAYPIIWPLIFVFISTVLGLLVHYTVERPTLGWLRARLARQTPLRSSTQNEPATGLKETPFAEISAAEPNSQDTPQGLLSQNKE